jgi:hypothetical protein
MPRQFSPVPLPIVEYPLTTDNGSRHRRQGGQNLQMVISADWGVSLPVLELLSKFGFNRLDCELQVLLARHRPAFVNCAFLAGKLVLSLRCAVVSEIQRPCKSILVRSVDP